MPQVPTYTRKKDPGGQIGAVRSNLHMGYTDLSSDMAAIGKIGKTLGSDIADDIFATRGKVLQDREDKNNSLILYGKMAQEKQSAFDEWKTAYQGSSQQDHKKAMENLTVVLNDIGNKYQQESANERVGAIMQTYHNETNNHYTVHAADYLSQELLKTTGVALDNVLDMSTREAISTGDYEGSLKKMTAVFNDSRSYLGNRSTDEFLKKATEQMTESYIRQRIANPDTAALMVQAWSNDKKYWTDRIDPNKIDEMERLMQTAGKQAKVDTAFTDLTTRHGEDYAGIQQELMSPDYMKKTGLGAKEAAELSNIFKAKENYSLADAAMKRQGRIDEQVDNAFKLANEGKIASAIRAIKTSVDIPEDKKFQYITTLTAREVKTDPMTFVNLYDKVRKGEVTATDIKTAGGVSGADKVRLLDAIYDKEGSTVKRGEDYLKSQIISTGPLGSPLPAEHERLYQAYEDLEKWVKAERGGGKKITVESVDEAAKKIASRYRPTINTKIEDYQTMFPSANQVTKPAIGGTGEVPKRKPGESIDDFLKRTGK